MRPTIPCAACGTVLGIPKAGMPAAGLPCNWCGYVNLPAADPKPEPAPAAAPAPAPAVPPTPLPDQPRPTPPAPQTHRWADDEDDNGLPYSMPPEPVKTRPCEACGKKVEVSSVVCIHCGYDAREKAKAERTYQPIDRTWVAGWHYRRRMGIFLAIQVANVVTVGISLAGGGSLPVSMAGIAFYVFLQAFLLGTFETIRIRRNKKGQSEVTSIWRICFIPRAPQKIEWRNFEGVAWGHYDATSLLDWVIAVMLLPLCLLPAILFWYYVIRSDRFYSAFARDRGYPDTYLYRGTSEQQARDIAQTATDATGLPLVTPL